MNSVLSYIAGFVVVLLIAALVGPTFVDWNRFRTQIETQGSKITGRELKIGGDIRFVVLPAPHLTLNDVSLSNLPGAENSDFARFGQIDGEVALAPLFSGEISVTSVTVTRPQLHLEVMRDGRSNWHGILTDSLQMDGLFGLSSVSLEKANFEDGTITYADHRNARSWRLDHVGGSVIATSLLGPVRANLKFEANEIPLALRLAIGNFGEHKAFPVTAEVQALAQPAKLLFSGVSTGASNMRLDGTGSFEYGTTKTEDGQKPKAPLRVEAGVVIGSDAATFRNLVVAMAGTTLKGEADADWTERPTVNMHLNGEALTLDPLVDRLSDLMAGAKVPGGSLATLPVPEGIDAKADVKVAGLLVHDVLVKDAALALSMTNGTLSIDRAAGDIGSGTQFELSGALSPAEDGGRFDGKVKATSRNMAALAKWLASLRAVPGQPTVEPAAIGKPVPAVLAKEPRRPFSVASNIQLTKDRLDFNDLTAAYAMTPDAGDFKGDLSFIDRDGPLLLRGGLSVKIFDLDPLIALWPDSAPQPAALLDANDLDLTLTADRLTIDGNAVSGLDMSAAVTKGELDIRRFTANDLAGAKVTLAGVVSGVTRGDLASLEGKLHGEIDAGKTDRLFALAGIRAPGVAGPLQLTLDTTTGEGDDNRTRLDTLVLKGSLGGSRVDAVLKRGRTSDGKVARVDLLANATNADGRALLTQMGFEPGDGISGAGTTSLQMSGATDKPYDTTLRVNVGQGTFNAKGGLADPLGSPAFSGHVDISAPGIAPVLAALGVPQGVADFATAQASGPSFVLSSDVKSYAGSLAFGGLEAVAGNLHLSGDASWQKPTDPKTLPKLTGHFEANTLDLSPIFAVDAKDKDTVWPTAALDWSVMGAFDGDVGLKVGTLKLGTLQIERSDIHLALAQGVLSATPFTAQFADGDATFGARIEGGTSGEPGIGLTVAVNGADIAKLGPQAFGGAFGTGRTSFDAELEGQGRSWLALISSISGKGTYKAWSAGVTPLDLSGLSAGLKNLKSLDQFAALEAQTLDKGNTPISGFDGNFVVKDGVARTGKDGIELKGGKGKLVAMLDLGRLATDAELDVTLDDPQGAPPFSITAAGKLGDIERRTDTLALQGFASKQIIAKAAQDAGVDDIPTQLKNLLGLSDQELKAKGPAVAGIPLPMVRPEQPKASLQ